MKSSKVFLLFAAALLTITSCKDPEPTIALITVIDLESEGVENATVRLFAQPTSPTQNDLIEDVVQVTDASGEALFDFSSQYEAGQAGFAVLNIEVIKDTFTVPGIIKIDPEMVNEQTIILQ